MALRRSGQPRRSLSRAGRAHALAARVQRTRWRSRRAGLSARRQCDAVRGEGERVLVSGRAQPIVRGRRHGTSFNGTALPTNAYSIGGPLQLGAYRRGELRGQNYFTATGGYLRRVARLPDFLGGPVYAGGWLDHGDAFDDWNDARWRANPGFGIVMDTVLGPAFLAGSAGFDGRWRTYVGIGRIFR